MCCFFNTSNLEQSCNNNKDNSSDRDGHGGGRGPEGVEDGASDLTGLALGEPVGKVCRSAVLVVFLGKVGVDNLVGVLGVEDVVGADEASEVEGLVGEREDLEHDIDAVDAVAELVLLDLIV